jgi:hypothetical protein
MLGAVPLNGFWKTADQARSTVLRPFGDVLVRDADRALIDQERAGHCVEQS